MRIPLKILIIEDSDDDTILLLRKLKKGGYDPTYKQVYTHESMRSALETNDWDLVIADHSMPQFNSFAALQLLKETGKDIPFIIVSGSIGEEIAVDAMKSGAHDYIMKGNLTRLLPAIERELREAKERQARKQAEELLHYQAHHDTLTGLVNRNAFEHRLEAALINAKDDQNCHILCYMDLDQFKIVNDTCGHVAGDELLKLLSKKIKSAISKQDTLARLGGDEFGILFENCSLEQAQSTMNTIIKSLKDFRFVWLDNTFEVAVSIGMVPITHESESITYVLSAADVACYAAKEQGRNSVYVYEENDAELLKRHGEMHWVSHINKAFEQDHFRLYYQTILPLSENTPTENHVEILIRMVGNDGQIIPPGDFIPAAERYNLMPTIDRWVIRNVFAWHDEIFSKTHIRESNAYTINLSGTSLNDDSLLSYIRDQFNKYAIPPSSVCFEITETAAVSNLSNAMIVISELKELGCCFALDDFGSGLSSFAYLKNLAVDILKIDGSFIKDMIDDPINYSIVESINNIGHVMGLKTIAEFVENEKILAMVKELGIDYAQGYGIERPKPITELNVASPVQRAS